MAGIRHRLSSLYNERVDGKKMPAEMVPAWRWRITIGARRGSYRRADKGRFNGRSSVENRASGASCRGLATMKVLDYTLVM